MVPVTTRPTRRPERMCSSRPIPGWRCLISSMVAAMSMARSMTAPEQAMNTLAVKMSVRLRWG